MKTYPSIPKEYSSLGDQIIYVQDKLDGSNIRVEWTKKGGFSKFGTRRRLLDPNEPIFGQAVTIFNGKYAEDLVPIFKKEKWQKVTLFMELYGENSFAGNHLEEDVLDLMLFDVQPFKKPFLPPKEFYKLFGHLDVVKSLYVGPFYPELVEQVKKTSLEGITFEGVVCKGPFDRKKGGPIMFKIKTDAWLGRLKEYCKGDDNLFNKLA